MTQPINTIFIRQEKRHVLMKKAIISYIYSVASMVVIATSLLYPHEIKAFDKIIIGAFSCPYSQGDPRWEPCANPELGPVEDPNDSSIGWLHPYDWRYSYNHVQASSSIEQNDYGYSYWLDPPAFSATAQNSIHFDNLHFSGGPTTLILTADQITGYVSCFSNTSFPLQRHTIRVNLPEGVRHGLIVRSGCKGEVVIVDGIDSDDIVFLDAWPKGGMTLADTNKWKHAQGIAADGDSLAVVGYRLPVVMENEDVTFTIQPPSCTAPPEREPKLYPYQSNYSEGELHGTPGSNSVTVPYRKIGDDYWAFAVMRAPTVCPDMEGQFGIEVSYVGATENQKKSISLYAPPLLTIHGIWSDGSVWDKFVAWMRNTTLYYYPAAIGQVDYKKFNSDAFSSSEIQGRLDGKIKWALNETHKKGVIATQVDVVGHSMGGLVTRHFTGSTLNDKYHTYGKGAINRLFTVDTPHVGSPLADWMYGNVWKQTEHDTDTSLFALLVGKALDLDFPFILGQLSAKMGMPISGGVVSLMTIDNSEITNLPSTSVLPYRSIVAVAPDQTTLENILNVLMKVFDSASGNTIDSVLGTNHDTIVPFTSQSSGATSTITLSDRMHTNHEYIGVVPNSITWYALKCWLREESGCELTYNDPPAAIASLQAPANATSSLTDDLGGYTEVGPENITFSPTSGSDLLPPQLQEIQEISVSSPTKTITRAVFYRQTDAFDFQNIFDVTNAPFRVSFTPKQFNSESITSLVIFSDNTYALKTANYTVSPPGTLNSLLPDTVSLNLEKGDSAMPIKVQGYFQVSDYYNALIDVTSQVTFSVVSGSSSVVTVSTEGLVTAVSPGEDEIEISYDGKTARVKVIIERKLGEKLLTRQEAAIALLQAKYGEEYTPPLAATGTVYSDVRDTDFAANWIEQLVTDGITEGCGSGKFCPEDVVTKVQAAKLVLKAKYGLGYLPPTAAYSVFNDVTASTSDADYIEALSAEGATEGCSASLSLYCPNSAMTRSGFSKMLAKTFGLMP